MTDGEAAASLPPKNIAATEARDIRFARSQTPVRGRRQAAFALAEIGRADAVFSIRALTTAAPTAPTTAPTIAFPIAAAPDEPHDEQQHDSAYGGVEDRPYNSDTKMDTEPRQQPVPNEGTDNTDHEVTNKSKTSPLHDSTGQPAGNQANEQNHKKTFT